MPRKSYQNQLERLREEVLTMGESACDQLDASIRRLEGDNSPSIETIEEQERQINTRYLAIESVCIDLLALQQPVAGDLRFTTASFKIITDLERIADISVDIAARSTDPAHRPTTEANTDLIRMARESQRLVSDAVDAYAKGDADACFEIVARDDAIDQLASAVTDRTVENALATVMADDPGAEIEKIVHRLLTIRDIERIADHAVNICARTVLMESNDGCLLR